MTDIAAIAGVIAKYGTTADGCGRVVIDLDEAETVKFQEMFGSGILKGIRVAVAGLGDASEEDGGG